MRCRQFPIATLYVLRVAALCTLLTPSAVNATALPPGSWRPGLHAAACDQRVWGIGVHDNKLVAVGSFSHIGPSPAEYVGILTDGAWQGVGNRLGRTVRSIVAVTTYNGELVVGGDFDPGVASWDGVSWRALGEFDAYVSCLVVFDGRLIAGGRFGRVNGVVVNGLAQWDGTSWTPVGGGVAGPLREVRALAIWDGRLLVGGKFSTAGNTTIGDLAQWDGECWSRIGDVSSFGSVSAIAVYEGSLIVGGHFFGVGGVAATGIAQWDGTSWRGLGAGVRSGTGIGLINCMTVHRGMLVVGGMFTAAGATPAEHLAFWDGTTWSSPLHGVRSLEGVSSDIRALCVHEDDLYIGGTFLFADSVFSPNLVRWRDRRFAAVEPGDGLVFDALAFHPAPEGMYAGGAFRFDSQSTPLEHVALWRGNRWEPLGAGVDGLVHALVTWHNCLIAGGAFQNAGFHSATNVACWDGSRWSSLGDGLNGRVWDLAVHDGNLFAAGDFTASGSTPLRHVAWWNGQRWCPVGDGLPGPVVCLQNYRGTLYAGGAFEVGAPPITGIAQWTGTAWAGVGPGVNQVVRAMTVWEGQLVLGGVFGAVGMNAPADRLATWNGERLEPMHSAPFGVLEVNALTSIGSQLFVGGLINAPWDGVGRPLQLVNMIQFGDGHWSSMGELSRGVAALATRGGSEVWVGGGFQRAGGTPSAGVAIWDLMATPEIPLDLHGRWDCWGVRLQWRLPAALSAGEVLVRRRSSEDMDYSDIGRVAATSAVTTLRDRAAQPDRTYCYQLMLIDVSRPAAVSMPIQVATKSCATPPVSLAVRRMSPGMVSISYSVTTAGDVTLRVFDVRGRVVRRLMDGWQIAGDYTATWDFHADDGTGICRGVYLADLRCADGRATHRVPILARGSK